MLETENQPNNPEEISSNKKNNKLIWVFIGSIIVLFVLVVLVFFAYKAYNAGKLKNSSTGPKNSGQNTGENKINPADLKPGLYTKDGAPLNLAEAQKIQQQNLEPKSVVLPDNFSKEYIPVKYKKLLSVAGTPNTSNAPYGAVFSSSGTIDEAYNEAKKYFSSKNWTITELTDRKIPDNGKQLVAQNKDVTIITTVSLQNSETAVTLNIISQ